MNFITSSYKPLYLRLLTLVVGALFLVAFNYVFLIHFQRSLAVISFLLGILLWQLIVKQKLFYELTIDELVVHVSHTKKYNIPFADIVSVVRIDDDWMALFSSFFLQQKLPPKTVFWISSGHHLLHLTLFDGKSIVISPRDIEKVCNKLLW